MLTDVKMVPCDDSNFEVIEFRTSIGIFHYIWNKLKSKLFSANYQCIATDAYTEFRAKWIAEEHLKRQFHTIHRGLCREFPLN